LEQSIRVAFDCKPSKPIEVGQAAKTFVELQISRSNDGFYASMQKHIARITELPKVASFDDYRRLRGQILWACNARPDICAFISI
jgi:hypothetical protein